MAFPKINSVLQNLIIRALTGALFVIAITSAIYIHPYAFAVLFALAVGSALWEFYEMTGEKKFTHRLIGIGGGMYLFTATFVYAGGFVSGIIFYPYILFLLAILISSLYNTKPDPVNHCAMSLFAQFYCAGLLAFLNFIVFDPATKQYLPYFALLIFIFVWLNDTFAYLTGITLGKHPFFPRVSPKKSWEGFWGGLVITLVISQVIAFYFPEIINWHQSLVIAAITVVFGTYGDLVESLLKRTCGAKDSGAFFPGHGGVLDRFDSVILAAPAVYIYMALFIRN